MAQLVEQLTCNQQVVGSSPIASSILKTIQNKKIIWLLGQAVKTPPFHGGNRGSIPLGVTICGYRISANTPAFQAGKVGSIPTTRSI